MLQAVAVPPLSVDAYAPFIGEAAVAELRRFAAPLAGARVLHLNATGYGGGVAELLATDVPLCATSGSTPSGRSSTQRRVLRRHQGRPQRPPGRRRRVDAACSASTSRRSSTTRCASRAVRLRRRPRPAAGRRCSASLPDAPPSRSGSGAATST